MRGVPLEEVVTKVMELIQALKKLMYKNINISNFW